MTGHGIMIHEVIPATEESNSEKQKAVLQRWSNKWNCFVDTTGCELADGDRVTIREHVRKPAVAIGGQQSKDVVRFFCWHGLFGLEVTLLLNSSIF